MVNWCLIKWNHWLIIGNILKILDQVGEDKKKYPFVKHLHHEQWVQISKSKHAAIPSALLPTFRLQLLQIISKKEFMSRDLNFRMLEVVKT